MNLYQMTLSGGLFILLIVAVRALALHRLPKGAFLALWEMAALRLLLPFTIPLPSGMAVPMEHLPVVGEYLAGGGVPVLGPPEAGAYGTPLQAGPAPGLGLPVGWLAGMTLMAAYFAVSYVRARRRFRCSSPDNTPAIQQWLAGRKLRRPLEVRRSALVASPLAYGVFHPVILLPENMERGNEAELTYILTHELIHIRRFDGVAKLAFAAALCVHWFNPLAWVMFVLANRDLELSCDQRVMDILGGGERASYALTLISMEEARSGYFSPCSHFSKLAIEERIEAIMKYKKASILAVALAAALVAGATTAFAASAAGDTGFGFFITDENGGHRQLTSGQVVDAARFSVDKDGDLIPDPDEKLNDLQDALNIPGRQFEQSDGVEYQWISKGEGDLDEDTPPLPPTRTEEEWRQIIADIESGKIPPFEIPDDPNITVSFSDYLGGSCTERAD